jgi:hypothetical protein
MDGVTRRAAMAWLGVLAPLVMAAGPGSERESPAGEPPPAAAIGEAGPPSDPELPPPAEPDPICVAPTPVPPWLPVDTGGPDGESVGSCLQRMGRGKTDARIPWDQRYALTTFGGPGDEQPVDCGDPRGADGNWYYAANLQRFPCSQRVRLVDGGRQRCVVVEVADTGPHACVEEAAALPAWDVSPVTALHLFDTRSAGWSRLRLVYGAPVNAANELGPCDEQLVEPAQFSRGSVGGACEDASECSYEQAFCLGANEGWPAGYCSAPCAGQCPGTAGPHALAVCARFEDGSSNCLARCDFTLYPSGCRDGYECDLAFGLEPDSRVQVCMPPRCELKPPPSERSQLP